ncbi:MAG: ATP-dependent endonuclease of the OLD family-like protein [Candidatus Magasanikbacteria bacterium GW2011_GWA2_56_11]|uniref:ATP-dependent endonuclease of the OLD family-like protein n=1 Tax=Candidatus Magasanikbacteria bacterium GW2011_GWA2_56_11 TaxID=1619044 RepID=A0A0G1YES8_9BACT|nr:MAG: ATP-dependent endonuclease of the OLD family-like protein [Candidatus Magasanikbacteria bacterium GW2011_GWA2_56_11]
MDFKKLKITAEWQQFENIEIDFHDRLTILTGANASGKTTLLHLLARHCGWDAKSLATPKKDIKTKVWKWFSSFWVEDEEPKDTKGELNYSDGQKAILKVPKEQNEAQYNMQIEGQQGVKCFFIPSHRSIFRYQKVTQIPTANTINKKQAFDKVWNSNKSRYGGGNDVPSSFHIKEALICWSIFGQGNKDMDANETLLEYYNGFQEVLKKVLPKTLGFQKFAIRNSEVLLICTSGEFVIDASSGGISAIIDLAWQIYFYATEEKDNPNFTVLIDEVENHLHPTMQRQILPDFLGAFPNTRFIVSTHNPLIVGSVKESNVYALRYNENNKIVSERLDFINKAKTAAEILDEVLGVAFTMPIWVEDKLNEIVAKYSKESITKEKFTQMRNELKEMGLEKIMPEAVYSLIENSNDQTK